MNASYYEKKNCEVTVSEPRLLSADEARKVPGTLLAGKEGFWLEEKMTNGAMAVQHDGFIYNETLADAKLNFLPAITVKGLSEADQAEHTLVVISGVKFTAIGNDTLLCNEPIGCGRHADAERAIAEWGEEKFQIWAYNPVKSEEAR